MTGRNGQKDITRPRRRPVGEEGGGCRTDACGIFTCNNHTALGDWVQDVYLPVAFG